MREIEFVPPWYTATHRKRKLLKLQLYCTVVVGLALATWSISNAQQFDKSLVTLDIRKDQLATSAFRVRERQEQDQLRAQYQLQQQVGASLGLNVESARIVQLIDSMMPKQMSLLELNLETSERPVSFSQRAAAVKTGAVRREMERTLNVRIKGVAPTNEDIASLLEGLGTVGFVDDRKLEYVKDRVDGDYLMHEFAIAFSINLDAAGGSR